MTCTTPKAKKRKKQPAPVCKVSPLPPGATIAARLSRRGRVLATARQTVRGTTASLGMRASRQLAPGAYTLTIVLGVNGGTEVIAQTVRIS